MGDGGIIALMSVVIRDRGTKGRLSCSGHESTRPVAVAKGPEGGGEGEGEGDEGGRLGRSAGERCQDSKYQQVPVSQRTTTCTYRIHYP